VLDIRDRGDGDEIELWERATSPDGTGPPAVDEHLGVVGLPGERVAGDAGLELFGEVFAVRLYIS